MKTTMMMLAAVPAVLEGLGAGLMIFWFILIVLVALALFFLPLFVWGIYNQAKRQTLLQRALHDELQMMKRQLHEIKGELHTLTSNIEIDRQ